MPKTYGIVSLIDSEQFAKIRQAGFGKPLNKPKNPPPGRIRQTFEWEVGGSEPNREIVSVRSRACTRDLVVRSELRKIVRPRLFPFSLLDQEGSSSEFHVVLMSPSEV